MNDASANPVPHPIARWVDRDGQRMLELNSGDRTWLLTGDQATEAEKIFNQQSSTPSTTLPCPPWCEYEAGHGFDSTMSVGGELVRFHGRGFGEHLTLVADEHAVGDNGPVIERNGPYLDISAEGPLTTDEARQLARDLQVAADFLAGLS